MIHYSSGDVCDANSYDAVSETNTKWESGRGYPSIDSLKEISKFFDISLDELLSSEEILKVAGEDNKQKIRCFRDLVFGLLDCIVAMFFFLPMFGQKIGSTIENVSMLELTQINIYIKLPYIVIVCSLVICGILTLALQNCMVPLWIRLKSKLSLGLSTVGALFFMLSLQPYAAMFTFLFLVIKALILIKWE